MRPICLLALAFSFACHSSKDSGADTPSVSRVSVQVHPTVATILLVTWTQEEAVDAIRVEYAFEDDNWLSTPTRKAAVGAQTETLLGIPAETLVRLRFVEGEDRIVDEGWSGTTGSLPADFPVPDFVSWDPALSGPEPWLLTSVDMDRPDYYGPWWVYIMDRQARVVWYREIPEGKVAVMSRVSADGTHVTWAQAAWWGSEVPTIERSTLDGNYRESVDLPNFTYTYDELPDGTLAYDAYTDDFVGIRSHSPDGTVTDVWDCLDWLPKGHRWMSCGTNTVHWSAERGTWLWSLYDLDTVLEVDPGVGAVVHSWGDLGTDEIRTQGVGLQMQHYPNWTPDGHLLLHTQAVGKEQVEWAREFTVDAATGDADQVWTYESTEHYADCSGEAVRIANGNTLVNYGCGGTILEVAPDGTVAWQVESNNLIGHQTLIADLYAVNRGP